MRSRRSIAILVFAPLLLAMAAGQAADLGGFREILEDYRVLGGAEGAVAVVAPALEALVGVALLARRRLPRAAVRAAAMGGLVVTVFWSALASQAFARGLALDNCGCFGVYLGQSLRWWILLEDAEFLLLAFLSARATGRLARSSSGEVRAIDYLDPESELGRLPADEAVDRIGAVPRQVGKRPKIDSPPGPQAAARK